MNNCLASMKVDPIPTLLASGDQALIYFTRRDLLFEDPRPIQSLWTLPATEKLLNRQQPEGNWLYPSKKSYSPFNYDLFETFKNLGLLVEQYGFTIDHPAIQRAAEYIFSCQTEKGDIRGIIGNQYMPYYHGAILSKLIKAGMLDDKRLIRGLNWLLEVQQDDGGWLVPTQMIPAKEKTDTHWRGAPLPPNKGLPHAHLATGMVLMALAEHPAYRRLPKVQAGGNALKSRFFKADAYYDRKAPSYWLKFGYPFFWTNLVTSLDILYKLGFPPDAPDIRKGLDWFIQHQTADGLWETGYGKGPRSIPNRLWIGLAVCRIFKAYFD